MALSLEKRIENGIKAIVTTVIGGTPQFLTFGDDAEKGAEYYAVRADRVSEDPPSTSIFLHNVTVIAHGDFDSTELEKIESLFSHSYLLSTSIRAESINHDFVILKGDAVDIGNKSKTGAKLDEEHRFEFGLWAQTLEHSDAA